MVEPALERIEVTFKIEGDLQRFRINDGDRVLLKTDSHLTWEQAESISARLRDALGLGPNRVIVVGPGTELAVIERGAVDS